MIVKDVKLTLLKFRKKEGVGKKSGKDYLFYTADVVDEDASVFGFNLDNDLAPKNPKDEEALLAMKNVPITASVRFTPKGFDVSGALIEFSPVE